MSAQALVSNKHYTFEEYLQLEEQYGMKMDYVDNDWFPKAESTLNHADIAFNIVSRINAHFRTTGGRCFQQSVQVNTGKKGGFILPDVVLTCSEQDVNASGHISEPLIIAEVLSNETYNYDWGTKWRNCRHLLSLKHFLFVQQQRPSVDLYTRMGLSTVFEYRDFSQLTDIITLPDLQFLLPLTQVYENIKFPDMPINTTGILWFEQP